MPQPERMTSALMPRRGAARPIGEGDAAPSAELVVTANAPGTPLDASASQVSTPPATPAVTAFPVQAQPTSVSAPVVVPPRRAPASTATTPMTVRFDPEQHRILKTIAFFEGTSIAAIIEGAVKDWLQRRRDAGLDADLY
jgi:hypothetical protein